MENITRFSWKSAIEEGRADMPGTVNFLEAMAPKKSKVQSRQVRGRKGYKRSLNDDEAQAILDRNVGQFISMILFRKAPKKFKFVPACVAVEMWRQGVSHKVFETLNHMGLSLGVGATRHHVDNLGKSHDKLLYKWKDSLKKFLNGSLKQQRRHKPETYGFCLDNVQIGSETKHSTSDHCNKFTLLTMCFAIKDRVPFTGIRSLETTPACDLDPYNFLPSPEVFDRLRTRMAFQISQILCDHLSFLEAVKKKLANAVPHQHSEEMAETSEFVTVGTVDPNPGTTTGMINVMEHLQKYMVNTSDCLASGDGQSIERMLHAQNARINGEKDSDRLQSLWSCPPEFHKEVLLLQDSNNEFFRPGSMASKSTICQLKNDFNHRSMKKNVMAKFQHVWDMYEFATEGYTLLYAMKLCGIESLDERPFDFPLNVKDQLEWLQRLAYRVVDFCWQAPNRADIQTATTIYMESTSSGETAPGISSCGEDLPDEVVVCSNMACRSTWHHLSCAGLQLVLQH